jgi:hypothetical protein
MVCIDILSIYPILQTNYPGFGRKMYTDYEIICKVRPTNVHPPTTLPRAKSYVLDKHPCLQAAPLSRAPTLFRL